MTENLKHLGIAVTLVEMQGHVMPVLDPEMGGMVNDHLEAEGIELRLGSPVSGFKNAPDGCLTTVLASGCEIPAELVVLSIGVRPRSELAKAAGLKIGARGGIRVDDRMRTSDPHIWAVGDAVEVEDFVTGQPTLVPLAGPANRQGRLAADVILGNGAEAPRFRGVQATSVCGVLGMTVASTGKTERQLMQHPQGVEPFEKIYLHPAHHAGYYPDAQTISMKLLFRVRDGRILGAQAVGLGGVEKRIDVISMAIQKAGTVFDLEEAELCYAPQYGSAKDPVNLAGMVAANALRGFSQVRHWDSLNPKAPYLLDVRDPDEYKEGHVPGAVNIPLDSLRARMDELPKDREIAVHCLVGVRSYFAGRILRQHGYRVKNLSGGYRLYPFVKRFHPGIP